MTISNLGKSFEDLILYDDFSLTLPKGKTSCLLGPSGCGKSSLLNMAAGLLPPDRGSIAIETGARLSYVFQEPRLLPWLSVIRNLTYVMDRRKSRPEKLKEAREMLAKVGLSEASDKKPSQLSGGMARRVGLARALLTDFDLMLLDEPLASMDQELKEGMINLLRQRLQGKTALLVTHDYFTARHLSDHIFLLSPPPVKATEIGMAKLEAILEEINRREMRTWLN